MATDSNADQELLSVYASVSLLKLGDDQINRNYSVTLLAGSQAILKIYFDLDIERSETDKENLGIFALYDEISVQLKDESDEMRVIEHIVIPVVCLGHINLSFNILSSTNIFIFP